VLAFGGGIANGLTLELINSTVSGNTVINNGASAIIGGGAISSGAAGHLNLLNTIVANNTLGSAPTAMGPGIFGTPGGVIQAQGSLIGTPSAGAGYALTDLGSNLFNTNPQLGPLQIQGGVFTPTEAVPFNSPAAHGGVSNASATAIRVYAGAGLRPTQPPARPWLARRWRCPAPLAHLGGCRRIEQRT
jgi:hypothetical protein